MTLPKIDAPIYELTLPMSKQRLKFRAFTVKEQKILLMAQESDDSEFTSNNVKQIIKNCSLSDIDVDNLNPIDIEYFFIQLRARSIGEIVESKYRCNNKVEDDICGNLMDVKIDLLDIEVDYKDQKNIIQLTDTVGIKLKYPDFKAIKNIKEDSNLIEISMEVICNSIEYIFDEDNYYYPNETPKQEIIEFIEGLNIDQFKKIEEFFNNLPSLKKELDVTCNKCGFKHHIRIEGLDNFLD